MNEDLQVHVETVDFSRDVHLYVSVGGTQWLVPCDGGYRVQADREAFMKFNPMILDLKALVLAIYEAIVRSEGKSISAVKDDWKDAFLGEIRASGNL